MFDLVEVKRELTFSKVQFIGGYAVRVNSDCKKVGKSLVLHSISNSQSSSCLSSIHAL